MTSPWVDATTRRSGRKPAQISLLAEPALPLDSRSDFWESRSCHRIEIPGLCAGGTARPWRGLLLLEWGSLQTGDVERAQITSRRIKLASKFGLSQQICRIA